MDTEIKAKFSSFLRDLSMIPQFRLNIAELCLAIRNINNRLVYDFYRTAADVKNLDPDDTFPLFNYKKMCFLLLGYSLDDFVIYLNSKSSGFGNKMSGSLQRAFQDIQTISREVNFWAASNGFDGKLVENGLRS